jgi:dTDP-4-amino-4,6-dideoxygalactose transaminase
MIPFSPPRMDDKITSAVVEALNSGWITTGPKTKLFEKKLSAFNGNASTLCVNSASGGMELMLRWFGVQEGDEVILPAYTYAATANVIVHTGAKPVFVDVQDDFNIDIQAIRKAISSKTKVIMPVDIGGWPCDYDAINALVNEPEIKAQFKAVSPHQEKLGRILILSDAAHSLGAFYRGKRTGVHADVTVFSFHAVKNLTTAEGGAIALNLPESFHHNEIYKELNIKSLHGQSKDALAKTQIGNWRYDIIEAGYKLNMTDIQAAMGLVELDRYQDDMLKRRKEIFELYTQELQKEEWAIIPTYESRNSCSSYHLYLLRIKSIGEEDRNQIIQAIFDQEVSVNVHYLPLPAMTFYKQMGYSIKDYPKTFELYKNEISLPVYYSLSNADAMQVIKAIKQAVNQVINP